MEGGIVISTYKPKGGKAEAFPQLMREHFIILKQQGLVTDRNSIMMESKDRTIIEVFKWKSKNAIETNSQQSRSIKNVEQNACDYILIAKVEDASNVFLTSLLLFDIIHL
jgi:hypothetical protein